MKVSEYHRPTCSDIHLRVALQFIPKWPKILRQTSRSPTEVYHMHIPRFFFSFKGQKVISKLPFRLKITHYGVSFICALLHRPAFILFGLLEPWRRYYVHSKLENHSPDKTPYTRRSRFPAHHTANRPTDPSTHTHTHTQIANRGRIGKEGL